jgi:hypothetical protein
MIASSHREGCFSVPISGRCIRSASLRMPTTVPESSITGSALMSCAIRSLTASAMSSSGPTVTTSRIITSMAFMWPSCVVEGQQRASTLHPYDDRPDAGGGTSTAPEEILPVRDIRARGFSVK